MKKVYKFKKGEIVSLDDIYVIQGLGHGDWWEKTGKDVDDSDPMGTDMGEEIIITKDIKITITIEE